MTKRTEFRELYDNLKEKKQINMMNSSYSSLMKEIRFSGVRELEQFTINKQKSGNYNFTSIYQVNGKWIKIRKTYKTKSGLLKHIKKAFIDRDRGY